MQTETSTGPSFVKLCVQPDWPPISAGSKAAGVATETFADKDRIMRPSGKVARADGLKPSVLFREVRTKYGLHPEFANNGEPEPFTILPQ
jgi:hypothetical protein